MNAVNLEKMYEVLKFVEYGSYCRRSMDCVHGMLLIDRMKNEAVVDKAVLFGWLEKWQSVQSSMSDAVKDRIISI